MRGEGGDLRAGHDEELRFHIDGTAEELIAAGWTPEAARAEAKRRFGDVARIRAELAGIARHDARRQRRMRIMDAVMNDVRFALRTLGRSRAFTVIAVLTLALGIGATTAIFSVVDGVLLRPLRLEDPDRLVLIWETNAGRGVEEDPPSPPNYLDWRAASRSFSGMAAFTYASATLTSIEAPEVLSAIRTSANLFEVLGVRPVQGRGFRPGEDEGEGARVAVLSHGAWQRLFGGAPDVVGRAIQLNGAPFEVVGIMPPDFAVPDDGADVWIPFAMSREHRQTRYLWVIARLAPGVTLPQTQQEMDGIAAELAQTHPEANAGWGVRLVPARDHLVRDVRTVLLLVLAAVAFVLLIACANVANLVLGRATTRQQEVAVRAALGAGRTRLHMQMLTESIMLALVGGLVGVGLAWSGVRAFTGAAPGLLPRVDEVAVDARVLAFALGISVLTGLLFGLVPTLRVGRTSAAGVLRESGRGGVGTRGSDRVRRVLIVGQVALALLLLVGAGLTLRSVRSLLAVDPGYTTQNVITARISLDEPRYRGNGPKVDYFDQLLQRMRAVPGVAQAGVTSTLPLTIDGIDFDLPYHAEGHPDVGEENSMEVDYRIITPGYLDAMGIPLLAGRDFTDADRVAGPPRTDGDIPPGAATAGGHKVVLVNETFARQHWPGESPIGKRIRLYYVRNDQWEIVGVVGDTRHQGLSAPPRPQVFVPLGQAEVLFGYMTVVVRSTGSGPAIVQRLREAAVELDANEPIYGIQTIEALRAGATARDRMAAAVFTAFALLAIALSAAGIYGVIAYQVARRTREIGVRIALGARRGRVVRDVVAEATGLALAGIALGTLLALGVTRFAGGMLYGVSPTDPVTFIAVALLLLATAVIAAAAPATRAAGIQPVEALRSE